jgi:hypothetical protein
MMAIHFNQNMYLFLNVLSICVVFDWAVVFILIFKYNGDESP